MLRGERERFQIRKVPLAEQADLGVGGLGRDGQESDARETNVQFNA